MNCFFDTSALAKLFQKEEGSDFVEKLINAPENDIWILDLTRIELLSSAYRRYRQKDISEKELEIIWKLRQQTQDMSDYELMKTFLKQLKNTKDNEELLQMLDKVFKN